MATKQADAATTATQQNDLGQERRSEERQQGGQQAQGSPHDQTPREGLARRNSSSAFMSPFTLLQRFFTDDISSLLDQSIGRRGLVSPPARPTDRDLISWVPKVDVVQQGNELVVRADVPGVAADDLTVEISEDAITISGERKEDRVEENGGAYRVERAYGAFFREIRLPEGAIVDQAKARFKDGVLEVTVPAPSEHVSRGRRLEISQDDNADAHKRSTNTEGPGTGGFGR
jgi:HSP20 family protein